MRFIVRHKWNFHAFVLAICILPDPLLAQTADLPLAGTALQTAGSIITPQNAAPNALPQNAASFNPRQTQTRVRGLVVPRRQAKISAAIAATIKFIGPDNGDRFAKGDTLVEFDCGIYDAELNRANASAEAAGDTARVKRKLAASGSISRLQAILAGAELKKARAEVVVAEARVAYCRVPAPFNGRVVRRIANAFETVAPRDPLIEIVDDSEVEIRVYVPSRWLRSLQLGGEFMFKVDETGAAIKARIIALGASIDSVSQLVELRARPLATTGEPEAGRELLSGMSGNASFPGVSRNDNRAASQPAR